jgi:hypothetical protein
MGISKNLLVHPKWLAGAAATLLIMAPGSAVFAGSHSDLDIVGFTATSPVDLAHPMPIVLTLEVMNNGDSDRPRIIIIEGRRLSENRKVFSRPFRVKDKSGDEAPTRFVFDLADFAPEAGGIHWIATLKDSDPDEDVWEATTSTINPEASPDGHGNCHGRGRGKGKGRGRDEGKGTGGGSTGNSGRPTKVEER